MGFQWSDWWLPPNHSEHGTAMDSLFTWIFWITVIAFVLVQVTLVVFLIKYRHRKDRPRAFYIHGNTRLEMAWTLVPAVILAVLALASKASWDDYRFNTASEGNRRQIMVIGQQFMWNVIYPGPDEQLGNYLQYPRLNDPRYRSLSRKDAFAEIAKRNERYPLGNASKIVDGADAAADDDWDKFPGRPIYVPAGENVEIVLGAKDVLHSFFLPNFRVKLDAVPGMWGHIYFKATKTSTSTVPVGQVAANQRLWIDRDQPGAVGIREEIEDDEKGTRIVHTYRIADPKSGRQIENNGTLGPVVRKRIAAQASDEQVEQELKRLQAEGTDVTQLTPALVRERIGETASAEQVEQELKRLQADLKAAGVTHLTTIEPFEIVCEELCGIGHGNMRGELIVLTSRQYDHWLHKNSPEAERKPKPTPPPAPPRTIASAGAN